MNQPFIIYALPRSRTAWLAKFLSYKDWHCRHEYAIYMRDMGDVRDFLSQPNTGCVETAAAPGRYLIKHTIPDIREVVVLRPVQEVVESTMRMDVSGVATYDRKTLQRNMEYGDRVLRKIAKDPSVLVVRYEDLNLEETCAKIFEHCLPYAFDKNWWDKIKNENVQVDAKSFFRYYFANKDVIENFKKHCKSELRKLFRTGEIPREVRA